MKAILGTIRAWVSRIRQPRYRNLSEAFAAAAGRAPQFEEPEPVTSRENAESIIAELDALGYFDYVPEAQRDAVREQLVWSAQIGRFGRDIVETDLPDGKQLIATSDRRCIFVDPENLADGSIATQLQEMEDILLLENVRLEQPVDRWIKTGIDSEHWKGKRYEVSVNTKTYVVYDTSNAPVDLDTWGLGHKRLAEILNDLLNTANSNTRAYTAGDRCDASVLLLTPAQFDYLLGIRQYLNENVVPVAAEQMELIQEDCWPNGRPPTSQPHRE